MRSINPKSAIFRENEKTKVKHFSHASVAEGGYIWKSEFNSDLHTENKSFDNYLIRCTQL